MTKSDAAFYLELWADWQDDVKDGKAENATEILADVIGAKMEPALAESFNTFAAGVARGVSFCLNTDEAANKAANKRKGKHT